MRAFAGLLCLAALATADVMESLRAIPQGWVKAGAPKPDTRMRFRIAVRQPDMSLLEKTLYKVSTPTHPQYGMHLKRDELKALMRPAPEATEAVLSWLSESGILAEEIEDDGDWVNFIATVAQAEKMMNTTFDVYSNTVRTNVRRVRTLHYSVPENLHQHIRMIQPTTRFGQIRPERNQILTQDVAADLRLALNVTACNATITPTCLKDLYNVNYNATGAKGNFVGIAGYLEQFARFADWEQFTQSYAPWAVGSNFTWTSVNGGILPQDSPENSVEANLDVEYAYSLSYPIPAHYYSTAGRGPLVPDLDQPDPNDVSNEPYLEFFTYLLSLPDGELPSVLTTSYGEDEQSVPAEYAKTVCDLIGQLGARGTSVIFSSGDTGVASACQTNDGRNATRFLPIFPAACPYVTSVGGTYQVLPEKAISFSSGGFSDLWPRPAYQDDAVSEYLSILGDRWDGLYNPEGRGFPDVAAQSYRFHVIDKGVDYLVGGTSASAPAFAGLVALLNDARLSKGLPTLGFLNPWIYSQGYKGLNDITVGGSRGCTGTDIYSGLETPFVPYASWNATPGWDPVTGYGTPDFAKLLELSGSNATYSYRRLRY